MSSKISKKKNTKVLNWARSIVLILVLLSATVSSVEAAKNKDVVFTKNMFDNTVKLTLKPVPSGPTGEGLRAYDRGVMALGATSYALYVDFVSLEEKKRILGVSENRLELIDGAVALGKNVPYCPGFNYDHLYERISRGPNDGSGLRIEIYSCY